MLSDKQLKIIVDFLATPSADEFHREYATLFQHIQKTIGTTRYDFVRDLTDRLKDRTSMPDIDLKKLIEVAKRLKDSQLDYALAKRLHPRDRAKFFPKVSKVLGDKEVTTRESVTTTANVAAYPVPIGAKMLRRKQP